MNELASAIEGVRTELAGSSDIYIGALRIVIPSGSIPDGFGGETEGTPTEYPNIPYKKIEPLGRSDIIAGGAQITTQTDKITLPATTVTKKIKPHYQLIVPPHDGFEEQVFENPITLIGSFDAFVRVAVTKV